MALILVIEDQNHVRAVLREILRSVTHDVRDASSAAAGIEVLKEMKPDAVLLDIMLPDASGTEVLEEIRRLRPDVPVIMMSGHADEALVRETLLRGAFAYIPKPFNVEQLIRVVGAALAAR